MTTTPDSMPAGTERGALAVLLREAFDRKAESEFLRDRDTWLYAADVLLAAGWSRSPRPATEASAALVPPVPGDEPGHGEECGETEPHRQAGAVSGCNGGDQHGDTVEDASAARPATEAVPPGLCDVDAPSVVILPGREVMPPRLCIFRHGHSGDHSDGEGARWRATAQLPAETGHDRG